MAGGDSGGRAEPAEAARRQEGLVAGDWRTGRRRAAPIRRKRKRTTDCRAMTRANHRPSTGSASSRSAVTPGRCPVVLCGRSRGTRGGASTHPGWPYGTASAGQRSPPRGDNRCGAGNAACTAGPSLRSHTPDPAPSREATRRRSAQAAAARGSALQRRVATAWVDLPRFEAHARAPRLSGRALPCAHCSTRRPGALSAPGRR
jgi:hypothetical protein